MDTEIDFEKEIRHLKLLKEYLNDVQKDSKNPDLLCYNRLIDKRLEKIFISIAKKNEIKLNRVYEDGIYTEKFFWS